ncbi:hypothetical protein [Litorihabitans aurantiacus]|uniref:hypothetical protein n=1 Tax=Litorihabitans aurantiacus TaxID=1930061 RepID=UPI0024E1433F|nr:hypothetical protein [Litorihabitans aurantiacus]
MRWPSWRRVAAVLAGGLVLGAVAGLVLDQVRGPRHEVTSTVMVQATPASTLGLLMNGAGEPVTAGDLVDVALLTTSTPLLEAAAAEVSRSGTAVDADDLAGWVTAEPVLSSHLLTLTVEAPDAALATAVADALTAQLLAQQQAEVDAVLASVPLPAAETPGIDPAGEQLRLRAELVAGALAPLRAVSTTAPEQTAPGVLMPAALGVVGFAAGALVVIGLSLRPVRPRTGLEGASPGDAGAESERSTVPATPSEPETPTAPMAPSDPEAADTEAADTEAAAIARTEAARPAPAS